MQRILVSLPKITVTILIVLAILNLLVGVFLRYVVGGVTTYMDWDPVPFVWVEEVGELALAWLTLLGAAIGVRQRSHFTLHVVTHRFSPSAQAWIERINHLLIAGFGGLAAWYGLKLCVLNMTLSTPGLQINLAWLYASCVVGGALIALYGLLMIITPDGKHPDRAGVITVCVVAGALVVAYLWVPSASWNDLSGRLRALIGGQVLIGVALIFVALLLVSMPIVFSLGVAAVAGLWLGGYPMQQISSALVSGSQSWVLLAIPAFVFAGGLMERCGMSHALVEFARALVGWVKGGLGMSVIVVAYFFSDICGSKMAEVSALGSALMPPLTKAGYKRADSASLIAAGTAMGMLVPPAIFMIVIAQVTNTSAVTLFVAGFVPALVIMLCLMALVYMRARKYDWPVDAKPSLTRLRAAGLQASVPMVVPVVILGGFVFGIITATEAGAVVAGYAILAAKLYYRNVSWAEMARIAYESAILTAAVVFLLAVASIFQYLMGVSGVPQMLADMLTPLERHPWLFLMGTAFIAMLFGMILEGLPAAVVLIPVVFPIAEKIGIDPIHFNIVQTAAVGIGLFLPPMGVGLLMALQFAELTVSEHFKTYVPYMVALFIGLFLIIVFPEISLALPRLAGLIK